MDAHFANQPNLDYSRYMDDFFIITKTRWQLRRAVRKLNQYFNQYGFRQHPDKTFIGPTRKGTDWMGYWLTDQGVQSVAPKALANHLTKLRRLYEQTRHLSAKQQQDRVVGYVKRWLRWLACGGCTSVQCHPSRWAPP
ncbi:reverse transcriptase domain-containing protein [Budvicia aquatica]|uniref:reverse transcriptase domain-containing protein n=1 Tax=Budvicia aquatica TaxID=82979 RepID=UPI0008FBC9D0